MPKISVIIPCYNCEQTLKQALDSCYNQGFKENEFEIVLVDDRSTDNTKTLIESLAKAHSNINFAFHTNNMGGGSARNTAVSLVKSEIIFCLDSDDLLPKNTLKKMYGYMLEAGCDGVTIHRSLKFNGNDISDISHIDTSSFPGMKVPSNSLIGWGKIFCPLYVNFMYTKVAFNTAGGYPTQHGFDTQGFAWRFVCAGLIAHTCPETEYLHRVNFNESYYLREYNSGKANHNWKEILLEHYYIFTPKAIDFIRKFDCADFSKDLVQELLKIGQILIPNFEETFGKHHPPLLMSGSKNSYISRYSLLGYGLRTKHKIKGIVKKILLKLNVSRSTILSLRRFSSPAFLYFLSSKTNPLSDYYGLDRGKAIDRFYIDLFLEKNSKKIYGKCLELLNNDYTRIYGLERVTKSDVLDIDSSNTNATVIGDIRNLAQIPDDTYDCIILTQVLQFIDDIDAAVSECYRILKPGGTVLATLPSLGRIDCVAGVSGDYWRFTEASTKFIFEKKFNSDKLIITSLGNARSGLYFYAGLAQEEVSKKALLDNDPAFPLIITVRATK